MKEIMKENYLRYASYVILDRAIPSIVDGLKPVQRRILYTLFRLHDGTLHKVANAVGQTMALHPHGDAPIYDALVNLANKNFLLDRQGNFGNIYTGDPASAARYIETRLSPLAKETLFNPDLMSFVPSYDGRNKEPITLSAKVPILLMQGAEGIAVGMSTRVLPHNFVELLEAEIAILEGKDFTILPDFPTGGIMDASAYDKGRGKVKVRAKVVIKNDKTIVIEEICPGTTTDSLTRSIDEAAKKGKIKIDSISDYTAEKVEIEIKLPRGQYAADLIDALYAFTDCEVSISANCVVIKDNLPCEATIDEILRYHVDSLKGYLKAELELERERLLDKVYDKTLEQIFIEKRIYKKIEELKTYEAIHDTIAKSLKPYHKRLPRVPNEEDRERLLNIPIRRISRFDIDKNQAEIKAMEDRVDEIEKDLKSIKRFTIHYLKGLIKKYGKDYPRLTKIREIEEIDKRAVATQQLKVGFDPVKGFIGTKIKAENSLECTNFDKLLLMYQDGSYHVINPPEKQYVHQDGKKVVYAGVADKSTVLNVLYKDPKSKLCYAKRFIVKKFILGREYRFFDEGMKLEFLSSADAPTMEVVFVPKAKQKVKSALLPFDDIAVKGVSAKGVRVSTKEVKKVKLVKKPESAKAKAE